MTPAQKAAREDSVLSDDALPEMTADEFEIIGDALLKRGQLHLAYLQYEKSLNLNPDNLRITYKKGLTLLKGKKSGDAVKQFQMVIDSAPRHALAYEGMGQAYFQLKNYTEAEIYLQKAVRLNPGLWKAHNCLGTLYDRQKLYSEAIQEYETAIATRPDKGFLYNNLGMSYFLAGMCTKATNAFKNAIANHYTPSKVYNNLGLSLSCNGHYSEALQVFKQGVGDARAYNNLGCIYLNQGKFKDAITCFEKAIEIDPAFYVKASENLKIARENFGRL